MNQNVTFGTMIAETRKSKNMSQKELAAKVEISPQYLNDIEHNKRSPSSEELIAKIATELEIDKNYLCFLAGKFPDDIKKINIDEESFSSAWVNFRKTIEKK